jgi:NOL1/NOP2/fmu family ribosome biogenesis protein
LDGLRVIRAGMPVAQIHKDRLEPAHALSHWFEPAWAGVPALDLGSSDPRVAAFLHGELLELDPFELETDSGLIDPQGTPSGWLLVRSDGLGLGWGKRVGTRIKNHYPKHLRST